MRGDLRDLNLGGRSLVPGEEFGFGNVLHKHNVSERYSSRPLFFLKVSGVGQKRISDPVMV